MYIWRINIMYRWSRRYPYAYDKNKDRDSLRELSERVWGVGVVAKSGDDNNIVV